jgi:predicted metal-binding protein
MSKLGPTLLTTKLITSKESKTKDYDNSILFQKCQPKFAKISITSDVESSSCLCNFTHRRSQCVLRKSTCMYVFMGVLSKTISFLLVQIAHMRAAAPINNNFRIFRPILLGQSLKNAKQIEAFEY